MRLWQLLLVILVLLLCHQTVRAVEAIDLAIGEIHSEDWTASNIKLATHLNSDNSLALDFSSSLLRLSTGGHALKGIRWKCDRLEEVGAEIRCEQSQLMLEDSPWGGINLTLDWQYSDMKNWRITLHQLSTGFGGLQGSLQVNQGQWQGTISGQRLQLDRLHQLLPKTMSLANWSMSGTLSFNANLTGYRGDLQKFVLELQAQQVSYSDAEGLQVGEGVGLGLDLNASLQNGKWVGLLDLSLGQGQLYSYPVFLSLDKKTLGFHTGFKAQHEPAWLQLDAAKLQLPGVVRAELSARMEQQQWRSMEINFSANDMAEFYKVLAQPYLIGTALDELSVQGAGGGYLGLRDNELVALDVNLHRVDVEDRQGRFGLRHLDTDFHWLADGKAETSALSVAGGHLFNIDFGPVLADMGVNDGQLLVNNKIRMPLLGGELSLNNLILDGLHKPPVKWQLAMSARGIQLEALSSALDWPALSGQLDGHIPNVLYANGRAVLDGELTMEVFGGRIIVDGLQVNNPMGVAPVLETQLRLQELQLAQLTNTFSFGRIEGLLEGEIAELQLVGWQLNRFKAGIRTPKHDKSRHRISQRAIDNLTSLGTGMSGGLSGTALRVFKDFGYERIALDVDLAGNMATLDGLPYKTGGYYIVKGSGLPRIDVIGHTRKIAWKDLVSRIQEARFDDMVIK